MGVPYKGPTPSAADEVVPKSYVDTQTGAFVFSTEVDVDLAVGTGERRLYTWRNITVVSCLLCVSDPSAGASVIFDVNVDGTTIYSTQANRPSCAAAAYAGSPTTPNTTAVSAGSYFTIDCDQVGSTTPGANAELIIAYY